MLVLRLLSQLPIWDSLLVLLDASLLPSETVQAAALVHLQDWAAQYCHPLYYPRAPSRAQIEKAHDAVAACTTVLGPELQERIGELLGKFEDAS